MRRVIHSAWLITLLALTLTACQTTRFSQDEIHAFVDEYEKKAEFVNRKLCLCLWDYYTTGKSDSLDYFRELDKALTADVDLLARVEKYRSLVSDEKYSHKLDIIYRYILRRVFENRLEIRRLEDSLLEVASRVTSTFEGNRFSLDQIQAVLSTMDERLRRREAYKSLSRIGDSLADGLARLARLRNQATARLGYNSYFDLMLTADDIRKTEFEEFIQKLDNLTAAPYRRIRDTLANLLGVDEIQVWDVDYVLNFGSRRRDMSLPEENQVNLAKATFNGIGINVDNWPIYMAPSKIEGELPYSGVLRVHVPEDVRMIGRVDSGDGSPGELFDQFARAVYAVHIDKNDYLFTIPPAPCFERAMSVLIREFMERESWLRQYAGIAEREVMQLVSIRDMVRLFELRMALVWLHFEREMYADPFGDLDRKFGAAYEKYMGIPVRMEASRWAARLNYINRPVTIQNDLLATSIVAQTCHYLEQKYGDPVDNPHTREFLVQNYYRFGGTSDWRALVSRGTGEELNPEYILSYCGI